MVLHTGRLPRSRPFRSFQVGRVDSPGSRVQNPVSNRPSRIRAPVHRAYQQPLNVGFAASVPRHNESAGCTPPDPGPRNAARPGFASLPTLGDEETVGAIAAAVDDARDVLVHVVEEK